MGTDESEDNIIKDWLTEQDMVPLSKEESDELDNKRLVHIFKTLCAGRTPKEIEAVTDLHSSLVSTIIDNPKILDNSSIIECIFELINERKVSSGK